MTPLIDATEMYLRTLWELEEEGVVPIRARIVERLNVSAPAVSETVQKLVDADLVEMDDKRHLMLTTKGREIAASVMRKHRLAERLLTDVLELDWTVVHVEACRWEHVISDAVEARLIDILDDPDTSPFGGPIPKSMTVETWSGLLPLADMKKEGGAGVVRRISEHLQADIAKMRTLYDNGVVPGTSVTVEATTGKDTPLVLTVNDTTVELPASFGSLIWVDVAV